MKKNIGSADKIVRVLLGIVILLLGIVLHSWWGLLGIIPLFTALVGVCPAYLPFRFSTVKKPNTEKS